MNGSQAEASNLTFAQTYILASKVKNKLTKEAANPKSLLWNLVVQANLFDNLMDHITKETEKRARDRKTAASTPRRVSFLLPQKESSTPEHLSPLAKSTPNYTHQSHVTEYEVASDSDSDSEDDYYYSDEDEDEDIESLHRGASNQVEALGHAVTSYELSVDLADSDSDEENDYYYSDSDDDDDDDDELSFAVPTSIYRYPLSRNNSVVGLSSVQEEEFEEENIKGPEEIDLADIVSVSELPELTRSISSSDLESDDENMNHKHHHHSTYIEPVEIRNKKQMVESAGHPHPHQQHHHHHRHTDAIYTIESVF
ncbi:uncharacterized protein KQ657_001448 [Scheffersomyces spartinae]|uniref:Uncharacterized protein n=1 Tax=Scheffersomyces spartinae TaxID=45513 RepID=A0A9P7V7I8_9ASCO|nr:uncharacterized protein KQ657_001448 [Scheffersomyces spartinae]KAG7192667.1 hypothetical protein KQ657_001448 [Scheffersomyces spartinae]